MKRRKGQGNLPLKVWILFYSKVFANFYFFFGPNHYNLSITTGIMILFERNSLAVKKIII